MRQTSYSCAHRCAPTPRKQTSLPEKVQSGDQRGMDSALVGPEVPRRRVARYDFWGTICQMVLSWCLGALLGCPLLLPGAWVPGGWQRAGAWGARANGGCWGWPAPGRTARE